MLATCGQWALTKMSCALFPHWGFGVSWHAGTRSDRSQDTDPLRRGGRFRPRTCGLRVIWAQRSRIGTARSGDSSPSRPAVIPRGCRPGAARRNTGASAAILAVVSTHDIWAVAVMTRPTVCRCCAGLVALLLKRAQRGGAFPYPVSQIAPSPTWQGCCLPASPLFPHATFGQSASTAWNTGMARGGGSYRAQSALPVRLPWPRSPPHDIWAVSPARIRAIRRLPPHWDGNRALNSTRY